MFSMKQHPIHLFAHLAGLLHVNRKTLQDAKGAPNMTFVRRQDLRPRTSGRYNKLTWLYRLALKSILKTSG